MHITSSSQQSNVSLLKAENVKNRNVPFSYVTTAKSEETVTKGSSTDIWKELSEKYDVRNATFEEIKEISHALYEAREVSLKDITALTFDYERAANDLRKYAPVSIPASFDGYETSENRNGERDWIAEFEARAEKNFQHGNMLGYKSNKRVLEILRHLNP